MRVIKSVNFDAAHFIDHDEAAPAYKRMHGHSFALSVEIAGEPDPVTGWVVDFAALTKALDDLRSELDHHLLNEIEGLERPTLENICLWVAKRLKGEFPGLSQVRIARPSIGETCVYDVPSIS